MRHLVIMNPVADTWVSSLESERSCPGLEPVGFVLVLVKLPCCVDSELNSKKINLMSTFYLFVMRFSF